MVSKNKPGPKPQALLLPFEIELAQKIGTFAASKWSLVTAENCISYLNEVLCIKYHKGTLKLYQDKGPEGRYALRKLLEREAYNYCIKEETAARNGTLRETQSVYPIKAIRAALPILFNFNEYSQSTYHEDSELSRMASEIEDSQEILNLVSEIAVVYKNLPEKDKNLLCLRFQDDLPEKEIAKILETSIKTIEHRITTIIKRIHSSL